MHSKNYKGFLYLFIVFGFVGLTLVDGYVPNENKVCAGIKDAAYYCFEVKPLKNAQKRQNEQHKSLFNNETTRVTQTAIRRKHFKILDAAEYATQNKNFAEQNKELKRNIAELAQILQQSISKIDYSFEPQQRQLEAEIERLNNQNKILSSEVNALIQQNDNQTEEIAQLKRETEDQDKLIEKLESELESFVCPNEPTKKFSSCSNLPSGVHNIEIENCGGELNLRCNNDVLNGGWIVILHRFNGSVNFYRNWNECRSGFGNPNGEFFIGLEKLYCITNSKRFELYIEYEYFDTSTGISRYDNFRVGDEQSLYKLESLGQFSGTSENEMTLNNLGQKFSTYDRDNDERADRHCAKVYLGAWWFKTCAGPNPFARYSKHKRVSEQSSMSWDGSRPIKSILMMIRPNQ